MNINLRVHTEDHPNDEFHSNKPFETYVKHFNDVQQELVTRNPSGWQDEFESRLSHFATEAGRRQGTHVTVEHGNNEATINVYSPYAARTMGILPMSHRTPKEREKRRAEETLAHEQFKAAVEDRLKRGFTRMAEAGLAGEFNASGAFTIDPDAEDPRDIYRPH